MGCARCYPEIVPIIREGESGSKEKMLENGLFFDVFCWPAQKNARLRLLQRQEVTRGFAGSVLA